MAEKCASASIQEFVPIVDAEFVLPDTSACQLGPSGEIQLKPVTITTSKVMEILKTKAFFRGKARINPGTSPLDSSKSPYYIGASKA